MTKHEECGRCGRALPLGASVCPFCDAPGIGDSARREPDHERRLPKTREPGPVPQRRPPTEAARRPARVPSTSPDSAGLRAPSPWWRSNIRRILAGAVVLTAAAVLAVAAIGAEPVLAAAQRLGQ